MRSVFGLLVALTGLFIVWLWATGRAQAMWQAVSTGSVSSGAAANASALNAASVNLNPYEVLNKNQFSDKLIQLTPDWMRSQMPTIPTYIPTVGNLSVGITK